MVMKQQEMNSIFDKYNADYMDTVYAFTNTFQKSEGGKKTGIRWGLRANHGKEKFVFFYGDTDDSEERKGIYIELSPCMDVTVIEDTPEQVKDWCERICGGAEKYKQMLNVVDEQAWSEAITLF